MHVDASVASTNHTLLEEAAASAQTYCALDFPSQALDSTPGSRVLL
jgi:hypothetical protein